MEYTPSNYDRSDGLHFEECDFVLACDADLFFGPEDIQVAVEATLFCLMEWE
jgi:hypothetical protein